MIKLLKELNVLAIQFGFETGDDKILKYAKNSKFISVEKNRLAATLCRKYGILVQGYIMLGFPNEGHKEVMKSYNFFKKYSDSMDKPNIVMVFPGTALQEELKNKTGKDYAKIHLDKMKLSFGGEMAVTNETIISKKLSHKEIIDYREMFHKAGIIKNKKYYIRLFLKLLFSKGIFLNMYYLYNVFRSAKINPKREFISKTITIS